MNAKISSIFSVIVLFAVAFALPTYAQQDTATPEQTTQQAPTKDASQSSAELSIVEDEDITASDLEVKDPSLLPDSGLYFFKNLSRTLRTVFTFDPVKKAELTLKYADERLIEAKKLAELTKDPKKIEKAMKRYEKEKERIQKRIEKIKSDPKRKEKLEELLDKISDREIKHQKLFDRIERDLPEDLQEKIAERKERALEIFTKTISEVDTPQGLEKRLLKVAERQKGSEFKNFKNLEILKRIEEKAPKEAKPAIRRAQENALKRLKQDMLLMTPDQAENLQEYIEKISGNPARQAAILSDLDSEDMPEELRDVIEKSKERAIKKAEKRLSKIKSPEKREKYLKFLEDGELSNIEILKELENNLDPQTAERIKKIRKNAIKKAKKELDDPVKREKFLSQIENKNLEIFDMLDEMEEEFGDDQKEIIKEARERAKKKILRKLENSDDPRSEVMLQRILSDNPNALRALEKIMEESSDEDKEKLRKIKERQLERINERLLNMDDPQKAERIREALKKDKKVREMLKEMDPEDEMKETKSIKDLFEKANDKLKDLREKLAEKENQNQKSIIQKDIKTAQIKINRAMELYQNENLSGARNQLISAIKILNDRMMMIEDQMDRMDDKMNRMDKERSKIKERGEGDIRKDISARKIEKEKREKILKDRLKEMKESQEDDDMMNEDEMEKVRSSMPMPLQ